MANQYVNKVIYGNQTVIDLTGDTIAQSDILSGKIAHLPSGQQVNGTCTYDADTSDATAVASEILSTKTAYINGNKITGSMANRGAITGTITTKSQEVDIPVGFHDGSGSVSISATEQAKLIPENIAQGTTILGVVGTHSGITPSGTLTILENGTTNVTNYASVITEVSQYTSNSCN